jgi:teichuronic acid biosynthesis glycosyltransferase TuaG
MAKNKKKIDIILPNYNSAEYIDKTIDSVINQSYKFWKLIIVDDFSDNKTKKILKKYNKHKKIKIFWFDKNRGAGFCRNFAIKKTNSPYIAFIDSDDIWKKEKLKNQINFMIKNNLKFTYTNYETFGNKSRKIKNPLMLSFRSFTRNTSIATSTMMIKRNIIGRAKFTNTKICEDYYFKCNVLKKIKYAQCLNKYLTKYRIRSNSLQSNSLRNCYWIWNINKNFNKLSILDNLISLLSISFNSLKKYGWK